MSGCKLANVDVVFSARRLDMLKIGILCFQARWMILELGDSGGREEWGDWGLRIVIGLVTVPPSANVTTPQI